MKIANNTFNLQVLQAEATIWKAKNFPNAMAYQPLLGVVEEVGELTHTHLKMEQGIRLDEQLLEKKIDAVGDIVIYLTHYCILNGIDLHSAVFNTWQDVKERDWIKYPNNGKTK